MTMPATSLRFSVSCQLVTYRSVLNVPDLHACSTVCRPPRVHALASHPSVK